MLFFRMWIKQFIRQTFSLTEVFEDKNQEIKSGQCNETLREFFNQNEVDEIINLIVTEHDFDNYVYSNITQKFGVLVDKEGKRLGSNQSFLRTTLPSHWTYCSWKLTKDMRLSSKKLFYILPNFFHCDGKCNSNNGDDQEWLIDPLYGDYIDPITGEYKKEEWGRLDGDGEGDLVTEIFKCYWKAGYALEDAVGDADAVEDPTKAKMGLCNAFKHLIQNCSIPIGQCIGNIAIKEVVMAEFLKDTRLRNRSYMGNNKNIDPVYFGNFTYKDCKLFGGNSSEATFVVSKWVQIAFFTLIAYVHVI